MIYIFSIIILICVIVISVLQIIKNKKIQENLTCHKGCIDNNKCFFNTIPDCPGNNGCLTFYDEKGSYHNPCGKYIGRDFSISECIGCKNCKYCVSKKYEKGVCIPVKEFNCKRCQYSHECYTNNIL
jgi:hypothetical protein